VIVVLKDGRIQEIGNYETLRSNEGEFAKLLQEHIKENARHNETAAVKGKRP